MKLITSVSTELDLAFWYFISRLYLQSNRGFSCLDVQITKTILSFYFLSKFSITYFKSLVQRKQ